MLPEYTGMQSCPLDQPPGPHPLKQKKTPAFSPTAASTDVYSFSGRSGICEFASFYHTGILAGWSLCWSGTGNHTPENPPVQMRIMRACFTEVHLELWFLPSLHLLFLDVRWALGGEIEYRFFYLRMSIPLLLTPCTWVL